MAPLGEDDAVRHFLVPVIPGLRQMHAAGIVHGSINPTNLYYQDATKRRFILGECVSTGTAMLQPAIFSPIERVARGVDWDEIFSGYCDGIAEARAQHGVEVRFSPDITDEAP